MTDAADELPHGPLELSAAQWRGLAVTVWKEADRDNLGLIAAGVAFFGVMAVFPALAAVAALYGILGDRALVGEQIDALRGLAPAEALTLAHAQMVDLVKAQNSTLALSGIIGIVLSLWSALQGVRAFIRGLTIVHGRAGRRGFVKRYVVGAVFTFLAVALALLMLFVIAVAPAFIMLAHLSGPAAALVEALRWPVLMAAVIAFAMALYRWGPYRKPPPWRWIWPGAIAASLAWLLASAAFSAIIPHMTRLGEVYGTTAGFMVLLLWFYMSALVFLMGGELVAELERCAAPPDK